MIELQVAKDTLIEPHQVVFDQSHYDDLTERSQYLTAWQYAQSCWGPIAGWRDSAQINAAIILLIHLGADRYSDAILLRSWRRFGQDQ